MGKTLLVFSVLFASTILFSPAHCEVFKTMNVSMPTNYGTFLGEIHYAEKDQVQALRVERIIQEDLIKVINYFEYVPHDVVHFNLDPYMRLTNGNARTFPTNIINLYNFPASNREHLITMENWIQGLVLHEFIHITHLDQTRDWLKVGRTIFGTIAKVPTGIVPHWFTEGIAVWGESHLINGGRLNNPLFNKELLIEFKDPKFCKTIDCLDAPGVYPQGSLSYWAGAQFIQYLENKKPKTIKCLVEQNSGGIPFFLNNAFEFCTGETAQRLFSKFHDEFIANGEAIDPMTRKGWGDDIHNVFGSDDFQKGLVLDGDRIFKVEDQKFKEALVSYDLKDHVNFVGHFPWPISNLAGMVDGISTKTSLDPDKDKDSRLLLVAFNDDPRFRGQNRSWKLINPDTLLIERTLSFPHDPSYVIPMGGENFITFSYWDNRWIAEKNGELLRVFSTNSNISLVKKLNDQILLKINDSNGNSTLVLTDFNLQRLSVVYQSSNFYDTPLITEKYLVIRENTELKLLEWTRGIQLSQLPKDILNRVTFAEFNEQRAVVLEAGLKNLAMSTSVADSYIKNGKTNSSKIITSEYQEISGPTKSSTIVEAYPRLDHLIPHWWFITGGNADNLDSIGATTSFVDPMEVHTLNATALIYPKVKKMGGKLDYLYKVVPVSDLWLVSAFANQEYSKTDFSPTTNLTRDLSLRTIYNFLFKRWTYAPGLYIGSSTTEDFISNRTVKNFGNSNSLTYQALAYDDLFQYFTGSLSLQGNKASVGNSFFVTNTSLEGGVRPQEDLMVSLRGTYGRLYKSDFTRGVIYAGGISDYSKIRTHEFYGLPYSNAFGNKIVTGRLMFDYNFLSVYRGKNFIPFFLREAHVIFGYEALHTDRIYLKNLYLKNQTINSLFIGPRLRTNLFYFVPANIDLIFSSIAIPSGNRASKVDLSINVDMF